jgi:hypothetical protein
MDSIEHGSVSTKNGKRNNLFILLMLSLFALSIFVLVYLKIYKNIDYKNDDNNVVHNEPNESSFGTIIGNIEDDKKNALVDPMVGVLGFVTRNKKDGKLVPNPKLVNGEIMLLVYKSEDVGFYYEVLSTTDSSIEDVAVTGSFIRLDPRIDNDRFFMLVEEGGYDFVKNFNTSDAGDFPNSLEAGDKIIFTCQDKGCRESPISWLLLIKK